MCTQRKLYRRQTKQSGFQFHFEELPYAKVERDKFSIIAQELQQNLYKNKSKFAKWDIFLSSVNFELKKFIRGEN